MVDSELLLQRQIHNRVSASLETREKIDPYLYTFKDGILYLVYETTSGRVLDPVLDSTETDTYVGRMEFIGVKNLERFFGENNTGTVVWISGTYEGIYKDPKVIVSKIVTIGDEKYLESRALVLYGVSNQTCLRLANAVGSTEHGNIEELRQTPVRVKDEINLWGKIEEIVGLVQVVDIVKSGDDWREKTMLLQNVVAPGYELPTGEKPLRCAKRGTPFQVFLNVIQERQNVTILECVHCPYCGNTVSAKVENGEIECLQCHSKARHSQIT